MRYKFADTRADGAKVWVFFIECERFLARIRVFYNTGGSASVDIIHNRYSAETMILINWDSHARAAGLPGSRNRLKGPSCSLPIAQ